MNRKGQIDANGVLAAFIGIIVAIAILTATYGDLGKTTNLQSWASNATGGPGYVRFTDAQWENLQGKAVSNVAVYNESSRQLVAVGVCPGARGVCNYTTRNNQLVDGTLYAQINLTHCDTCDGGEVAVNMTYFYQDLGYITDGGGRGIAGLIAVFAAIAIIVIALVPAIRGLKEW